MHKDKSKFLSFDYLKQAHPVRYHTLVLTYEYLWTYLADLNEQAWERLEVIMEQMKAAERVTEELKVREQWLWIQKMNSIRNRAEEIVRVEMICI